MIVEQIVAEGYASVQLGPYDADRLAELYEAANEFFQAGPDQNARYSNRSLSNGYRPPEAAYAADPSHPDTNDSFLYWDSGLARAIPNCSEIQPFLATLEAYRISMGGIMRTLMKELAARYDYDQDLPFERASVLQVNSFGASSDRELLQERHEDGVLATVIWTSAPGLEGFVNEGVIPLTPRPDEVFIMPGSVLEVMTNGDIKPLYHQARNHGLRSLGRKSIMYFSCPNVDEGPITPYVVSEASQDTGINHIIRASTDMFGLPTDFVVDH